MMVVMSQRVTTPIADILQSVTSMKEKPGDRIQLIGSASKGTENGKVQDYNCQDNGDQNQGTV